MTHPAGLGLTVQVGIMKSQPLLLAGAVSGAFSARAGFSYPRDPLSPQNPNNPNNPNNPIFCRHLPKIGAIRQTPHLNRGGSAGDFDRYFVLIFDTLSNFALKNCGTLSDFALKNFSGKGFPKRITSFFRKEQEMNLSDLPIGTRVYNHGDMANFPHFGVITAHRPADRFSAQLQITPDPDAERRPYWVPPCAFSRQYAGHGGTRLVTETAYHAWRA